MVGALGLVLVADMQTAAVDGSAILVVVGAMIIVSRCISSRKHGKPEADAYETGWDLGYDKGYRDGRKVARPVVVMMEGENGLERTASKRAL
jgi:hypothetical protein